MKTILNFPLAVLAISFAALWLATKAGAYLRRHLRPLREDELQDFQGILAATLTLLGLIIGFSFSMAISRYDQRKNLEESEANAIGTEYVRTDLVSASQAAKLQELLRTYLDLRIRFYTAADASEVRPVNEQTEKLQAELWSVTRESTTTATPLTALVVSGMNDVLNAQGYTQAAWWNRIPVAAWGLMAIMAVFCNLLVGYGSHRTQTVLFLVLPLVLSIAFSLIADIDSPRGGVIRVLPQNLMALSRSLPR